MKKKKRKKEMGWGRQLQDRSSALHLRYRLQAGRDDSDLQRESRGIRCY